MTLQQRILNRIKIQHVRPTPRSFFKARDYMLWVLLGIFIVALSLGSSMVIFLINGIDRGLFARLGLSIPQKVFYSIPYFWIAATIIIAVIAFINFRRTRHGYRITTKQLAIMTALAAIGFGSIIYVFNISKYIDRAAIENIPLYSSMVPFNTSHWFDPEHGLLSGSVKVKNSNNNFTLRDQNFDLWSVVGNDVSIRPEDFKFNSGDRVKLIGKKTSDLHFTVLEIRPYDVPLQRERISTTGSLR